MHYFLSTFGSAGDVFPMLGLATEIRDRGYRVTLATNQHFEENARACGIDFVPLGTEEDYQRCASHPDLWHFRKSFAYIFEHLKPWIPRQYEALTRAAQEGPVTAIVNCFGFGALAAQEKHGIPVYTLHLQPAVLWSDLKPPRMPGFMGPRWFKRIQFHVGEKLVIDRTVCPYLNQWRKTIGLPPVYRTLRSWNSPRGIICLFPSWYAEPQPDWPQPCYQTDFPLWNSGSDQPMDKALSQFIEQGDAPIVFTPGSANYHGKNFFQAALEACVSLKRRGVFLTGHAEQVPKELPSSIHWCRYVPLDQLLPRSAGFVHHGGIGSASQALLAGVPQLIMPLAHDQFDNAERLQMLGVASSLAPSRFTGKNLSRVLDRLLRSEEVSRHCAEVALRLEKGRGLKSLVLP